MKTLDGLGFYVLLESGAIQEVRGSLDRKFWAETKNTFFIDFSFEDGSFVRKELPAANIATDINWRLILEKWQNKDYTNLPTRKDFEKINIQDFLINIGVLQVQTIPNQWINGQPAQQLLVTPEYKI